MKELIREKYWIPLDTTGTPDIQLVGGKNANLIKCFQCLKSKGIQVPIGVALSTLYYTYFVHYNQIDQKITRFLQYYRQNREDKHTWMSKSEQIRQAFLNAEWPQDMYDDLYERINILFERAGPHAAFAVRSSATAEDLPNASFAGQQDTYLMLCSVSEIMKSIIKCYASLWNDRAIEYREEMIPGLTWNGVGMSIVLQRMARSDLGSAGVAFSLDPETGYRDSIVINSAWGLGEAVVQGAVIPDEWIFQKTLVREDKNGCLYTKIAKKEIACRWFDNSVQNMLVEDELQQVQSLSDQTARKLAEWVLKIEDAWECPVDVEWAYEEFSNELWIVQVRPETVHSKSNTNKKQLIQEFSWKNGEKPSEENLLVEGVAVGQRIQSGKVVIVQNIQQLKSGELTIEKGSVLVTGMTDPDWEPWMRLCNGMITDQGGRTCHAAIIAREMGIPAIVGCLDATLRLQNMEGYTVTLDCSAGEVGRVYAGHWETMIREIHLDRLPPAEEWPVGLCLNVGSPERAFIEAQLPSAGVGLARLEFIISQWIGVHPGALASFNPETDIGKQIQKKLRQGETGKEFYIRRLTEGMARIAGAFYPREVIVRFSDFKSNEYRNLLGGSDWEPHEENPMIGWRGASRYVADPFREWFGWECEAVKRVREEIGCKNLVVMIPFCRTPAECENVLAEMAKHKLVRGENELKVYLMCEIPSNVILAEQFLQLVDGYSIGSNDLTQLTLGLDRDAALVAHLYDERNPAILNSLESVIRRARNMKKKIGICGQAPSDFPEFAEFLMKCGIHTISVVSESFWKTALHLFCKQNMTKELVQPDLCFACQKCIKPQENNWKVIIDPYLGTSHCVLTPKGNQVEYEDIYEYHNKSNESNKNIQIIWDKNGDFIKNLIAYGDSVNFDVSF